MTQMVKRLLTTALFQGSNVQSHAVLESLGSDISVSKLTCKKLGEDCGLLYRHPLIHLITGNLAHIKSTLIIVSHMTVIVQLPWGFVYVFALFTIFVIRHEP